MGYKAEYGILLFGLLCYLCIPLYLPLTSSSFAAEDRPFRPGERIWVGFTLACMMSLLLPPGVFRHTLGAFVLLYFLKEYPKSATGQAGRDYLIAINVTLTAFKFADFVYLRTPEDAAHRVNEFGEPIEDGNSLRNASYLERLKWAANLFTTLRGVGWNWRVKNVQDVPPSTTRRAFRARQAVGFIYSYTAVDFLGYYLSHHPAIQSRSPADYFALPVVTQVQLAWMMAFRSGFEMGFGYYLMAGTTVCFGLYDPQYWPPMFGSFSKVYTIRNIWGVFWHQNLRRPFETYGTLVCETVGLSRGTIGSAYLKLYFSFLFSAYIHNIGAMNIPYTPAVQYQFWFFLLQPVAITIEDIVCGLWGGGRFFGRGGTKNDSLVIASARQQAVGYLWVFGFLSFSLRYMAAYVIAAGFSGVEHPLTQVFGIARHVLAK